MTTLCLCDVNEHELQVFAEIAAARRSAARADGTGLGAHGGTEPIALPAAAEAQA